MNALSLYVNTFRLVLRASPEEGNSWTDIYSLMSCLRQSLLCCVCRRLMIIPMCSSVSSCQHNVCKLCVGGKMRLRPLCIGCSDSARFKENVQLRVVLQCYKKMCKFMMMCPFYQKWSTQSDERAANFTSMVHEGTALEDDYHYASLPSSTPLVEHLGPLTNIGVCHTPPVNGERSVYSILVNDNNPGKVVIRRKRYLGTIVVDKRDDLYNNGSNHANLMEYLRNRRKRKSCRCGLTAQNPGKLTCCGQRCPCYVGGRACFNCHCRGCRNPQKINVSAPPKHRFHPNFPGESSQGQGDWQAAVEADQDSSSSSSSSSSTSSSSSSSSTTSSTSSSS